MQAQGSAVHRHIFLLQLIPVTPLGWPLTLRRILVIHQHNSFASRRGAASAPSFCHTDLRHTGSCPWSNIPVYDCDPRLLQPSVQRERARKNSC
ncbi:hypothetical protein VTO73DRAFT_12959 [Trametes versicolor]